MNNNANGRIKTLEVLRALAFICVFLHHTGLKYFKFGAGGVSVFLILSGFVLVINYYSTDKIKKVSIKNNIKFSFAKIKKLYGLHVICTLLMTIFVFFGSDKVDFYNICLKLLCNLLLIQEIIPMNDYGLYRSINPVSWYLCTAVLSWFIFPFIIKKMKESYDILYALISIFVLFFIQLLIGICGSKFSILPSTHDEISFWTYDMTNWLCYTNPFVRLLDFIIGCNLGYLFLNIKFKSCLKIKYYTLFEIIAIVLFIVANIIYVYNRQDINSGSNVIWSSPRRWWTYTIIFTPISCALILLFAYGKGGISNNLVCNQLLYVAKISPYAFLIHYVVFRYISFYNVAFT